MFTDRIKATLTLTIGTTSFTVRAGDLIAFHLAMEPWGFAASAEFWLVSTAAANEDTLFAQFVGLDAVTATLALQRALEEPDETTTALTVKGLVTTKAVVERVQSDVLGGPVLQRKYTIHFADRGGVLWRQHRPTALYVDSTITALLAANTPAGVTIEASTWPGASVTRPILALGLGVDDGSASFWDFLGWLVERENAGLYYDVASGAYAITSLKPPGVSTVHLRREHIATVETVFPTVRRDKVAVLNAFSEAATRTKDVLNPHGVVGVRRDYLTRSSIEADITTRAALEGGRARQREPEVVVCFAQFPTTPVVPSAKVDLGEGFATTVFQSGKTYRALTVTIDAHADEKEAGKNRDDDSASYSVHYEARLETSSDPVFHAPPHVRPTWPFQVEGKVLSEVGQDTDGTYQSYKDAGNSLDLYKVKIPLWADAKVIASFEPGMLTGHFYFPVYRDARVLVALDFEHATITGFLDWRPGARLPLDTQGNHILVGKGAKNQTSIKHVYEDQKPALSISRSSNTDLQVITVVEGVIRMETKDVE